MLIQEINKLEMDLLSVKNQCKDFFHENVAPDVFTEDTSATNNSNIKKYRNYFYDFDKKIILDIQGREIDFHIFLNYLNECKSLLTNSITEYDQILKDLKNKKYHIE